jgi:uncharacterized tellurite resistance protein B-like protein
MKLTLEEKLAVVKTLDEMILADGKIVEFEMAYFGQLMRILEFDIHLVEDARNFDNNKAIEVLKNMSDEKKNSLAVIMHEMANADGDIDDEEKNLILAIFSEVGINLGDFDRDKNS